MEVEVKYYANEGLKYVEEKLLQVYSGVQYLETLYLPAIYYDTWDGRLEKAYSALRVREEKGKLIGCYKATTEEKRQFVEEEIVLLHGDLSSEWYRRLTNYAKLEQIVGGQKILPLVKIETQRKVYLLSFEGLLVEIVLDYVTYLDGKAFEERVEVELKEGTIEMFRVFVAQFEEKIGGLSETHVSKYQKAKELLQKSV